MKTDRNGVSTCPPGCEQYEWFNTQIAGLERVQYDYRTEEGTLFTCIAVSLEDARKKRDAWLETIKEYGLPR